MKTRTVDCITALVVVALCSILLLQLTHIPREGKLFPSFVLWLLMGCSVCLAGRALLNAQGVLSFFGGIPMTRWLLVSGIFLLQVLGALFVSFKLSMFLGIFVLLHLLTARRSKRATFVNLLVAGFFVLFFELFFSTVMHIYFPEPLFDAIL